MDGPPLQDCTAFVEVYQGDTITCSGTLSPTGKLAILVDSYLRIPILEAEKRAMADTLAFERQRAADLKVAAVVEWYESPMFWVPVTVTGILAGILVGAAAF